MAGASVRTPDTLSPLGRQILALLRDGQPRSAAELAARLGMPSTALAQELVWLLGRAQIQRTGTRTVSNSVGGHFRVSLWRLRPPY